MRGFSEVAWSVLGLILLFKMKNFRLIPIGQIIMDHTPLNQATLSCASAIKNKIGMPPIKVVQKSNGQYKVKDGRHRITASKLNGIETIFAQVSKGEIK